MRPEPKRGDYLLERTQFLPLPRAEVFAFFEQAANLERITPDHLHFHILTPLPIEMRAGAQIEYSLRFWGLPLHWRTDISAYEPPCYFADEQIGGPYALWYHEHEFHEVEGGTLMVDRVHYSLYGWVLGWLANRIFVRDSLEGIFDYRTKKIEEIFGLDPAAAETATAKPSTAAASA